MPFRFESMIIEIHAPHAEVNESILKPVKEKVLSFSHLIKDIVKAEIILRDDAAAEPQDGCFWITCQGLANREPSACLWRQTALDKWRERFDRG